jgi:hypothetical protein
MPDSPSQTAGMLSPLQLLHSSTSKGQPAHENSRTGEYSAYAEMGILCGPVSTVQMGTPHGMPIIPIIYIYI